MHTHRGVLQDDVSAFLSDQRLDVFLHVSIWTEEHSVERTRITANGLTTRSQHSELQGELKETIMTCFYDVKTVFLLERRGNGDLLNSAFRWC